MAGTMRVLISRPDKIGDVLLALHGAKQLKTYCPELQVFMHVADYTRPLVENMRFIDGVLGWDEALEPYEFDAVVDLMAKLATARRYAEAGIPLRIGNSARWFRLFHNRTAYIRRSQALRNEAEYNWQLISLLDVRLHNTRLREAVSLDDFREIRYPELPRPYYCFFPGVSVSAHAWPIQSWGQLAAQMLERSDKDIVCVVGPAEVKVEHKIRECFPKSERIRIMRVSDLKLAAGILQRCEKYVGPSTGITHIAGAVGAEGIALYPEVLSMHPGRWAPFKSSLVIRSPASRVRPAEVAASLLENASESTPFRSKVSAFVICKNEEDNNGRCLDSVRFADEILVVDSGSTDQTLEVVKQFPRTRVISRDWPGHREQKQFSLERCRHKWVLNLDADEELSAELKGHIIRILEDDHAGKSVADGYFLCRVVYYLNRWWDKGGWHPEYRMRFFQREKTTWGGMNPHEKALVSGTVRRLPGFINHYTSETISDFVDTQNRFSTQSALAMHQQGIRSGIGNMVVRPIFRFFKFFVIKQGFREGRHGFIQAVLEAVYTFLKYAKLWEIQRVRTTNVEKLTRVKTPLKDHKYADGIKPNTAASMKNQNEISDEVSTMSSPSVYQ